MYNFTFFKWAKVSEGSSIYRSKEFSKSELIKRSNLPITPGCYIWLKGEEILYIGTSSNIRNRLGNHLFANITDPKSNAIYTTTARDAVAKYFYPEKDHEGFRNLKKHEKEISFGYMEMWNRINQIVRESKFVVYSTRTPGRAAKQEEDLILEFSPICNNLVPNAKKIRDDFKVLGIRE